MGSNLGGALYNSKTTLYAACQWEAWNKDIQYMEELVDSTDLVDLAAKEYGHLPKRTIQWSQAAGGCTVSALDMAQSYGERLFFTL